LIYLLHIETSGAVCSVCLSADGKLLDERQSASPNLHAKMLTLLIEELMAANRIAFTQLRAVAVSIGPGSYTGLRIGLSAAKGLCYALSIPLITVSTLAGIVRSALAHDTHPGAPILATIDARRDEVYMGVYDSNVQEIQPVAPKIVNEELIESLEKYPELIICGNGAFKFNPWLQKHKSWRVIDNAETHARHSVLSAYAKFANQDFADVAYTEPLYLKEFVGATPK